MCSSDLEVVDVDAADNEAAIDLLAQQLVDRFGAPDLATARAAALEEMSFAAELAQQPAGMLIAVSRRHEDGGLREAFRALTPRSSTGPIRVSALQTPGVGDEP